MGLRLLKTVLIAISLFLAASSVARADGPIVYAVHGAAIDGYDVVAYFHAGEPTRGTAKHHVKWRGAVWYFVSARNRETFESNPRAYAPQYGGYCAYAMVNGHKSKIDPFAWKIVDGQLYLMHGPQQLQLWQGDVEAHVTQADLHWVRSIKR